MNLAPNVYLAVVDDRSIALDLDRDRYVGLGRTLTQAAVRLTDPAQSAEIVDLAAERDKLIAKGILSASAPARPQRSTLPAATSRWPSDRTGAERAPPIDWQGARSALAALTQAELSLRIAPFRRTIERVAREKARAARPARRTEQELLDAYAAARPWFPVKPICRLDAIALCLHLTRGGQSADLVFGVRLDPFHAHCWVQRGDAVLNEPHDGVLKYTPIMVV